MFLIGSHSVKGTSQTWATGVPVAVAGATARGTQREPGQSLSEAQSVKHQALPVEVGSGFKQTEPAAQLSLGMGEPGTVSISHASSGCLAPPTLTHAGAPVVSIVHFSWHRQPVWHAGSHTPVMGEVGVHRGCTQLPSSKSGASAVLPPSVTTPPCQQWPSTQE